MTMWLAFAILAAPPPHVEELPSRVRSGGLALVFVPHGQTTTAEPDDPVNSFFTGTSGSVATGSYLYTLYVED